MSVDSILNWPCDVKIQLEKTGNSPGVVELVELLKTRHRVVTLARIAQEKAIPEEQMSITIQLEGPANRENSRQVSLPELRSQALRLEPFDKNCLGCPANVSGEPFGCVHFTKYPIPQAAEQWLMDRIQPLGTPGCFLLLASFQDLGYDGEPIRGYRERGLFESTTPILKTFPPNKFNRTEINSDQLFHAVFGVGIELEATHLMMVLMWLGAIALDGQVPTKPEQFGVIAGLTPAQRKERTQLYLGAPEALATAGDFPGFLALLFRCWQLDQPALVDS
jgi:hypothetical protein